MRSCSSWDSLLGRSTDRRPPQAALHGRARAHLLEPALEVLELVDVLALRLPADGPGIADDVGDREVSPAR